MRHGVRWARLACSGWGISFECAECSPGEAQRNPGGALTPDYASLHPGYRILMALHALLVARPGNPPLAKTSALNCSMVTRWRIAVRRIRAKASDSAMSWLRITCRTAAETMRRE